MATNKSGIQILSKATPLKPYKEETPKPKAVAKAVEPKPKIERPSKPKTTLPQQKIDSGYKASQLSVLCDEIVIGSNQHEFKLLFRDDEGNNLPLHKIGQTNLLKVLDEQIKAKKSYDQQVLSVLSKDTEKLKKGSKMFKAFTRNLSSSYKAYYKEFDVLDNIQQDILEFYNKVHLLLISVYMIKNNLTEHPHLTFSEAIKKSGLKYDTRLKLHDLNKLRNVLIHNNINFKMNLNDWLLLQTSFQELSRIVNSIVKDNKSDLETFRDNWLTSNHKALAAYETNRMQSKEKTLHSLFKDI